MINGPSNRRDHARDVREDSYRSQRSSSLYRIGPSFIVLISLWKEPLSLRARSIQRAGDLEVFSVALPARTQEWLAPHD